MARNATDYLTPGKSFVIGPSGHFGTTTCQILDLVPFGLRKPDVIVDTLSNTV